MDLLILPLSALWQQKTRTLLTTLGVVFGSFVLAASLSIGQGVQDTVERELHRSDNLRKIFIQPRRIPEPPSASAESIEVPGEMDDAKRQRIRKALTDSKQASSARGPRVELTQEILTTLSGFSHVESVVPVVWQQGFAVLNDQSVPAGVASARPEDESGQERLVYGRFFESPTEKAVVISELLAYRLSLLDDSAVKNVVGEKLRLEFRPQQRETGLMASLAKLDAAGTNRDSASALEKAKTLLPMAISLLNLTDAEKEILQKLASRETSEVSEALREEFTIVGVVRLAADGDQRRTRESVRADADVLLPIQTATDLYFRSPGKGERGVDQAVVIVDHQEYTKEVIAKITELGIGSRSSIEFIERERLMYLLIFGSMTCIATIALLVASLGIANTMLMSVLERTREIGIMKAVGAGNGQLQFIFLVEGALIGFVGGVSGLLLAWIASIPGDAWIRSMVFRDTKIDLKQAIFSFPLWLILVVIIFAIVFTTLAAVYPARRAAAIDPVMALRHE